MSSPWYVKCIIAQVAVGLTAPARALADGADAAPTSPYDRKLLPLAYLAPQVQSDLLAGRQPPGLTFAALLRREPPLSWRDQPRWLAQLAKG